MTDKQKNTALMLAIAAGVFSLPLTWVSIRQAQLRLPSGVGSPFGGWTMGFDVTGINGRVTFLLTIPLWFVIGLAISANVLQLLRRTRSVRIPPIADRAAAVLATFWTTLAGYFAVTSVNASLGLGWLLGLACALVPLVALYRSEPKATLALQNHSATVV